MADKTEIEWADSTWNPWVGCTKISVGDQGACEHCYAEAWAKRTGNPQLWEGARRRTTPENWKKPLQWNAVPFFECPCGWRGIRAELDVGPRPHHDCPQYIEHGLRPARRRVFCASLADVFDNVVPTEWRAALFALIRETPNLDWLLLTKRIGNASNLIEQAADWHFDRCDRNVCGWLVDWYKHRIPPANVWLGSTMASQPEFVRDIGKLMNIPARVRFISFEPLLGAIDMTDDDGPEGAGGEFSALDFGLIHWAIVGGESGPSARPIHPEWARSLRDQCVAAGVAFLFKQWGEWWPISQTPDGWIDSHQVRTTTVLQLNGEQRKDFPPGAMTCLRVGKKVAGRLLDGRTWDQFPVAK